MTGLQEHNDFTYSSASEWDSHEAHSIGQDDPSQAWVCTGNDVWHANPYYNGPTVPHPEDPSGW